MQSKQAITYAIHEINATFFLVKSYGMKWSEISWNKWMKGTKGVNIGIFGHNNFSVWQLKIYFLKCWYRDRTMIASEVVKGGRECLKTRPSKKKQHRSIKSWTAYKIVDLAWGGGGPIPRIVNKKFSVGKFKIYIFKCWCRDLFVCVIFLIQ